MELRDVRLLTEHLNVWAELGTVHADGRPHRTPIHPDWTADDTIAFGWSTGSATVDNAMARPDVTLRYRKPHRVVIHGRARVHGPGEERTCELWARSYELMEQLGVDGPNDPNRALVEITPLRAVVHGWMGLRRDRWAAR